MRTRAQAAAALTTLASLPDDTLLQVIAACTGELYDVPLFDAVKGLACISKGMRQQLHRLQPLVGVQSLTVVQRPAHGPWRVMLQHRAKLTKAVVQLAQQGRVHSIHYGRDYDKPQGRTLLAPSVVKRVIPVLLGEGCSLLEFSLLGVELNGTWATTLGKQAVCSAVLLRLYLFQCGLRGPLPELRLPVLQNLDLSFNELTGGLEPLSGCTSLQEISLFQNRLTGGLEPLRGCTALRSLSLHNNKITGGFEPLRGCTALRGLTLCDNQLTGDLKPLWDCASLRMLQLKQNPLIPTYEDRAHFEEQCSSYLDI